MQSVPFSLRRVALIAAHTVREAVRHRLLIFFGLVAAALVIGARWLGDFNFGAPELKFLADTGRGGIAFFGAALVIVAMAHVFLGEIENRTALTLLAKPVWRSEFVWGKWLGVVVLAGLFCAVLTLVLAGVIWLREGQLMTQFQEAFAGGRQVHYPNLAIAAVLEWARLAILAALTLLVASFAQKQVFAIVTGFLAFVICHLQSLAHESYARSASGLGYYASGLISTVFPDFALFGAADSLAATDRLSPLVVVRLLGYASIYIVAAVSVAVYSFRRREI